MGKSKGKRSGNHSSSYSSSTGTGSYSASNHERLLLRNAIGSKSFVGGLL
jgi:hypothetical protein